MIKELIKLANELDQRGLYKEASLLDDLLDAVRPKAHSVVQEILDPLVEGSVAAGSNVGRTTVTTLVTMNKICERKEDIFLLLDAAKVVRIFSKEKSEALIIGAIVKSTGLSEEKVIAGIQLLEKYTGFGMEEVFEKAEYIKVSIRLACKAIRPI